MTVKQRFSKSPIILTLYLPISILIGRLCQLERCWQAS